MVQKPWGKEVWFAVTPKYVGKFLCLKKGHRLSKQYHKKKMETLYADKGTCLLEINGRRRFLRPGASVTLGPGTIHRLSAPYGSVRLVEVSTPEVEDVVRLSDDYGRGPK